MLHLARTTHLRRAFAAACMPYVLASIFVDFLHVHPQPRPQAAAAGVSESLVKMPASRPASRPDYVCPACLWLRVSLRATSEVSSGTPARAVAGHLATLVTASPDSPIPHSAALRGPPASSL